MQDWSDFVGPNGSNIQVPQLANPTLMLDRLIELGGLPTGVLNGELAITAVLPLSFDAKIGRISISSNPSFVSVTTSGEVKIISAGHTINIKSGSNSCIGSVNLSSGTATISSTAISANSRVFITPQTDSIHAGYIEVLNITPGSSFEIKSSNNLDDRTIAWIIIESN